MNFAQTIDVIKENALDLLYPTLCLGCDTRGEWFCAVCTDLSQLKRGLDHCQLCNKLVKEPGDLCPSDRTALGLTGLVSFGDYRCKPLRRAIRAIKFDGIFAGVGGLVAAGQVRYQPVIDERKWTTIIPIPLSRQRLRERGFNQATLIAGAVERTFLIDQTATPARIATQSVADGERFAERHGKNPPQSLPYQVRDRLFAKGEGLPPFAKEGWGGFKSSGNFNVKGQMSNVCTDLVRTRDTQHQTELGRKERQENLDGAFAWRGGRLSGSVLLIDDVVTTGATLAEAARVLRSSGAQRVWALTLAYETPSK